jgi:hypothetical protein
VPIPDQAQAELDALLASLDMLTEDDVWYLAEMWQQEDAGARKRAWAKARLAIEKNGSDPELTRVRTAVGQWMQASRSDFHGIEGLLGSAGGGAGGRRTAAPAFVDAAVAILAGGALEDEHRSVLLGPWQKLTSDEDEQPAD